VTAVEQALAQIWSDVLSLPRVGAEDDFFSLGGDSLLSIQVVSKAKSRGIPLDYKMVFQNPTIRKLAASVQAKHSAQPARVGLEEAALTPIQRRFFAATGTNVRHWNQWALVNLRAPVRLHDLHLSVRQLFEVHDVLRLSFCLEEGRWRQRYVASPAKLPLEHVNLADLGSAAREEQLELSIREANRSLDPENGELIRFVYLDRGAAEAPGLLIVAHHLIMDNVSFHILADDLDACLSQCASGCIPSLESNSCTYKKWSETLTQAARAGTFTAESDYWLAQAHPRPASIPCDSRVAAEQNTYGLMRSCSVAFSEQETRAIVNKLPALLHCSVNSVLLDALTRALYECFGVAEVVIDIETHGRRWIDASVDLRKATGWYTSIFPQRISGTTGHSVYERIRAIDRQLRAVPNGGLGYGVLRYLAEQDFPDAEICFNYLGQVGGGSRGLQVLDTTNLRVGASHAHDLPRSHLLLVEGAVAAGKLVLQCYYGSRFHHEETIRQLLGRMQKRLSAQLPTVAAGFRRSFRRWLLDQPEAPEIGTVLDGISVLYPVLGIQASILFQHLSSAEGVPPYLVQVSCALRGNLDLAAFERAWQLVLARHEALRTSFHWVELDAPVQAVHREALLSIRMLDWRNRDEATRRADLLTALRTDRMTPIVLDGAAPLMRVTLIRAAEDQTFCIWTHHHIQLDGWSQVVVLRELFQIYRSLVGGEAINLPSPPSLGEYFRALDRVPLDTARRYWREYLSGFTEPTAIATGAAMPERYREEHLQIEQVESEAVHKFARSRSLTLQTLFRAAWSLWLTIHSGKDDVLFGTVVAGRNCDMQSIENLVGTLINTIPVRVRFPSAMAVLDWLRAARDEQAASHPHELLPLAETLKLAPTERGRLLFESILVFENLPGDYAQLAALAGLRLEEIDFSIRENYPVVVSVRPAQTLTARISYRIGSVDPRIRYLGMFLGIALAAMIRHEDQPLQQLTSAVRDQYFELLSANG
jgi:non-ribosomal peptide synthase protein (TIGR01720 family)